MHLPRTLERGSLDWLNGLDEDDCAVELRACCAAGSWVRGMVAARPFSSPDDVWETSDGLVSALDDGGLGEALAAHARIVGHEQRFQRRSRAIDELNQAEIV